MKIIAHTERGYIVEISRMELNVVTGEDAHREYAKAPIGMEVAVLAIWRRLQDVLTLKEKLQHAAKTLRSIADITDTVDVDIPVLPKPDPEDTTKI